MPNRPRCPSGTPPDLASSLDRPVTCLVWALEGAIAAGDFKLADVVSNDLLELGVELRFRPRGHELADRATQPAESGEGGRNVR